MPLGLPHWALLEFTTRRDCRMDPAILLGLKENYDKSSMLDRYEDRQGSSHGVLSQRTMITMKKIRKISAH